MGKYSLDGTTRRIAGGCSLVAGALAVFWLMQNLRGHVPARSVAFVDATIYFLSLVAVCFGLLGSRREVSEMIANAPFIPSLLSMAWALGFVLRLYSRGTPDLGRAGIVTVAVAVGLVGAAYLVRRRCRSVAQPGV
jgi:FtsH-binding integral membrane protein